MVAQLASTHDLFREVEGKKLCYYNRARVANGAILDLDLDPFLNNGLGSEPDLDSGPILLVPDSVSIGKPGSRIRTRTRST